MTYHDHSSLPAPPVSAEPRRSGLSPLRAILSGAFVMGAGVALFGWVGRTELIQDPNKGFSLYVDYRPLQGGVAQPIGLALIALPLAAALYVAVHSNVRFRRSRGRSTVLLVLSGLALVGGVVLMASVPSVPDRLTCERCTATDRCEGNSLGGHYEREPTKCPDSYDEGARSEVAAVAAGLMAAGVASGVAGGVLLRRANADDPDHLLGTE